MTSNLTVQKLATDEDGRLAVVEQTHGPIEERTKQLEQAGVFEQYRAVHAAYAHLLTHSIGGLEALKRALFLQWIVQLEPSCFTGVRDIDSAAEQRVIEATQQRLVGGVADAELPLMLRWYDSLTDWYFGRFAELLIPAWRSKPGRGCGTPAP